MNYILLVIFWLAWTSCAFTGQTSNNYIGQPFDNYVAKNGPSPQSYPIGNGLIVHTYEREGVDWFHAESCVIKIRVDEAGIITEYNSQGC